MQVSRVVRQFLPRSGFRAASDNRVEMMRATLSDLPSPEGSFKTHNDALQRKYTMRLILGIGMLTGTIIFGKSAGLLEMYGSPPDVPAEIDNYKN